MAACCSHKDTIEMTKTADIAAEFKALREVFERIENQQADHNMRLLLIPYFWAIHMLYFRVLRS